MRRSGRIPKEIPIVLIGSDLSGKIFSEETKTVLLSLHGAGLLSRHKLSPEQEMVLRWPEHNKEAEIRVVGQIGEASGVYTYGVAFFDHVENFWEMEFPPPSARDQQFGHLTLVCNICQSFDNIDDTSVEADVCATNEGVFRYCRGCGTSTVWKMGLPGALPAVPANPGVPSVAPTQPPAPSVVAPPQLAASPPASFPNYLALVRHAERGEGFVQCEDVSRGGLRFKSTSRYMEQTLIEVAAPSRSGQPAIFVAARTVFVQELPEQNLFRYGVQYLHTDRPRGAF